MRFTIQFSLKKMIEPSQGKVSTNAGILEVLLKIDDSDYLIKESTKTKEYVKDLIKKEGGVTKEDFDNSIKNLHSFIIYSMRNTSPLFLKYYKIKNKFNPAFWLSSKFPNGLEEEDANIADLSGSTLTRNETTTYSRSDGFLFNTRNSLISSASFANNFTFFLKARHYYNASSGRFFTSSTGNKLLGWWGGKIKCAWIEENIWGVDSNRTPADFVFRTYILISDGDNKKFYDEKSLVTEVTNTNGWDGNVVIGRPSTTPSEAAAGYVSEVLCLDRALTKTEMEEIYDNIFA